LFQVVESHLEMTMAALALLIGYAVAIAIVDKATRTSSFAQKFRQLGDVRRDPRNLRAAIVVNATKMPLEGLCFLSRPKEDRSGFIGPTTPRGPVRGT
jgi:hypothetical protein